MIDDTEGRKRTKMASATPSKDHTQERDASTTQFVWSTLLRFFHLIIDFATTASLLAHGFVGPELRDQITDFGMGKDFVPERDIGSLEGKVILVTGGT